MHSVWLIHNNIPPYRVPLFAEIAQRADFDVCVVLTAPKCRHRPHWHTDIQALPVRVKTMTGFNIPLSDAGSVSISLGLLPSLIRHRPDVVICNGFGLSTFLVFIYARLFRRPYVVWSESTPVTEGLRRMGRIRRWLRGVTAGRASAFIDAGTLARDYVRSLLPANSQVPCFRAYNCVDGSLFSAGPANGCCRTANGSLRRILFVGRLNENKGIPMLLDVFQELSETSSAAVGLVLAGDGPLRERVLEFQRGHPSAHIELAGQVAYEQTARYYRECDVFVLLSLSDCNPLVILEALHAGIPIVCTNRAGNAPDFIVSGENGYIVDPTNKDEIVGCIRDVLTWENDRRAICQRVSREQVAKANYTASAAAFISACRQSSNEKR